MDPNLNAISPVEIGGDDGQKAATIAALTLSLLLCLVVIPPLAWKGSSVKQYANSARARHACPAAESESGNALYSTYREPEGLSRGKSFDDSRSTGTDGIESIESGNSIRAERLALLLGEKANATQREALEKLFSFATTGKMTTLRGISREQAEIAAAWIADNVALDDIVYYFQNLLNISPEALASRNNPKSCIVDILEALRGEPDATATAPRAALVFTDGCDPDGTVTGNAHVIPAGTQQVFAVFQNSGDLAGLDRILAIWRNPRDDRMVYARCEPLRGDSAFNYVWLQVDQGWPVGYYQLELHHPDSWSRIITTAGFNVR